MTRLSRWRRFRNSRFRSTRFGFPNADDSRSSKLKPMLHIPILRHGKPYVSIDKVEIVHHATGEPVASVSQANAGLIARDISRMNYGVLDQFKVKELIAMSRKAADLFLNGTLPVGDEKQS